MSLPWTLLCAALVGVILPLGAWTARSRAFARARVLGGAVSVGVLIFALWGVLSEAFLPLDGAIEQWLDGLADADPVVPLIVGFFLGLLAGYGVLAGADAGRAGHPEGARRWERAGWGAGALIAGLVLGSASSSEDLALSVVLVIGLVLAHGSRTAEESAGLDRQRRLWVPAGLCVILALVGVLIGQGFPIDASAVPTLAVGVVIWAAGTGGLTYLIVSLLAKLSELNTRWALHIGVLVGLGVSFALNLLLMVVVGIA